MMRPVSARWFELLTSREELTHAVELLARTGSIELETHSDTQARFNLPDLQLRMEEYHRLARRYHQHWPQVELNPTPIHGSPSKILDAALLHLQAWEQDAGPLVQRLESIIAEQSEMRLLANMLDASSDDQLDFSLLGSAGPYLYSRLFVLPEDSHIEQVPAVLLTRRYSTPDNEFLLAVGTPDDMTRLADDMTALKGHEFAIPTWVRGDRHSVMEAGRARLAEIDEQQTRIGQAITDLAIKHEVAEALGDIRRMEWFMTHVNSLPVTENFAWVTGWTSDQSGTLLKKTLDKAGVNAIIHYPDTPEDVRPPMVLKNPWWAQPFELFSSMLGTPAGDEADPSRIVAVLVPLLFGYMFGDVGQGLVLLTIGILFYRRYPLLRILIANGLAAVAFGFVFGSFFGREDVIPAFWLHPLQDPLPVMLLPLAGGVVILLLGLILNAFEAYWRHEFRSWIQLEAAVLLMYVSILASIFFPKAVYLVGIAVLGYFLGSFAQSSTGAVATILTAAGRLLENMLQLMINTFSFVRVGAFALAHAGLSLAFFILASSMDNMIGSVLIMIIGNLVVICLEGLVVTIQTTRLILFEFFIRFMRGTGRMFRPLAAPSNHPDIGKKP